MTYGSLDKAEFAKNSQQRCPLVLVLDTSGSMAGQPIAELNEGLKEFDRSIKQDRLASLSVEVAVVTFGEYVQAMNVRGNGTIPFDASQAFVTASQFVPPLLQANGLTPMGDAVRKGLLLLQERKKIYKSGAIDYLRPWLWLITDGEPTDTGWEIVADEARKEEQNKGVNIFAVGVQGANMTTLGRFCERNQPLRLKGLAFHAMFQWLSNSMGAVSRSRPGGEQVALPAVGWGQVDT